MNTGHLITVMIQPSVKFIPQTLQTDMGKEFYNDNFRKQMEKYNNHYRVYITKNLIVERVIRNLTN